MTFDEYQKQAITTVINHPDPLMNQTIMALGIAGEAGEVADKWKKLLAYRQGVVTPEDIQEISKEVGDVLWYLAVFVDLLGVTLEDVAVDNLTKLADRQSREAVRGSGDNR